MNTDYTNLSAYPVKSDTKCIKTVFVAGRGDYGNWRSTIKRLLTDNVVIAESSGRGLVNAQHDAFEKEHADAIVFVITPSALSTFDLANAVNESNKRPEKTIVCFLSAGNEWMHDPRRYAELSEIRAILESNGARCLNSLSELADII
ncbi:MAG: hypothetical protein ACRBF0_23835 [Calditrichia bacterium]